jgi:fructose-1,6-bisphosphatase/inositol monophosphatase family enzyme
VRRNSRESAEPATGTVYANYMPPELGSEIVGRAEANTRHVPGSMAGAIEYTSLAVGEKDYVMYHRLHPWDHAAGALLVCEAGGDVRLANGRLYSPRERSGPCLATAFQSEWAKLRDALLA